MIGTITIVFQTLDYKQITLLDTFCFLLGFSLQLTWLSSWKFVPSFSHVFLTFVIFRMKQFCGFLKNNYKSIQNECKRMHTKMQKTWKFKSNYKYSYCKRLYRRLVVLFKLMGPTPAGWEGPIRLNKTLVSYKVQFYSSSYI